MASPACDMSHGGSALLHGRFVVHDAHGWCLCELNAGCGSETESVWIDVPHTPTETKQHMETNVH